MGLHKGEWDFTLGDLESSLSYILSQSSHFNSLYLNFIFNLIGKLTTELGYFETQIENFSTLFLGCEIQCKLKLCYKYQMCLGGNGLNVKDW